MAAACPSICVYTPPTLSCPLARFGALRHVGSVQVALVVIQLLVSLPTPFYMPLPLAPLLLFPFSPGGSQSVDVYSLQTLLGGNTTLHGL